MSGLDDVDLDALLNVDPQEVKAELDQIRDHLAQFGDRLPDEIRGQLEALEARLQA
jgi:phosphoenolpyruvate carboxykinase (GTP)